MQNYFTKIHVWTEKKKFKKITSTGSPFSLSIINHSANVKTRPIKVEHVKFLISTFGVPPRT